MNRVLEIRVFYHKTTCIQEDLKPVLEYHIYIHSPSPVYFHQGLCFNLEYLFQEEKDAIRSLDLLYRRVEVSFVSVWLNFHIILHLLDIVPLRSIKGSFTYQILLY